MTLGAEEPQRRSTRSSSTDDHADVSAQAPSAHSDHELNLLPETAEIFTSVGVQARAKKVGDQMGEATVTDADGQTVRLSDAWRNGPLVIVFVRGGQCMRCDLQLQAWRHHLEDLVRLGAFIVAISPRPPDHFLAEFEGLAAEIPVLCDTNHEAVSAFNLSVILPEDVVALYPASDLDAPVQAADGRWVLPIPATYVVDRSGQIRFAHVDGRSHRPIDPGVVLRAVEGSLAADAGIERNPPPTVRLGGQLDGRRAMKSLSPSDTPIKRVAPPASSYLTGLLCRFGVETDP
jgi:peroxiredoxin